MTNPDTLTRMIGERVRAARTSVAMTRKQLSAKASVSERYLNELENGEANASVGILGRVAEALNVDIVSFLTPASQLPAAQPSQGSGGIKLHSTLAGVIGSMSLHEQEAAAAILERYIQDRRKSLRGVALLGLRGAGKTTIGSQFAQRHGLPFLSTTREIELRAGMNLNDLFNLGGPEAYRTLENEVVKELSTREDRIVLETAGGLVSNGPALDVILGSFKTIWLKASPDEHLSRVVQQGDLRPMRGMPKALEHLKALLTRREQEYTRADSVLDTTGRTPASCVDELELLTGGALEVAEIPVINTSKTIG